MPAMEIVAVEKAAVLILLMCAWSVCGQTVLVDTVYGPVEGHTVDLSDGSLVNSFLAIPFAKPPNGTRRWKVKGRILTELMSAAYSPSLLQSCPMEHDDDR